MTHYGGCALLYSKDTFYPNIDVKSIYLHDTRRDLPDQVTEGGPGVVCASGAFTCLMSSTSSRRPAHFYSYVSASEQYLRQKKRGVAKMLILNSVPSRSVNRLTWLQVISMEQHGDAATQTTSALSTKLLRTARRHRRRAPRHCGDPDRFQTIGLTLYWKVRMHGAFSIPRKSLCLRPTDQSCHHETWLHLDFVDWRNTQSHHQEPGRRILLKERPTACPCGQQTRRISEVMSDHSLSS